MTKVTSNPRWPVILIVTAAITGLLFTVTAGSYISHTTHALVASSNMVEHTQDVLGTLQTANQTVDRVEYSLRLYRLTKEDTQLTIAQMSAARLNTSALHIEQLVSDNSNQTGNVHSLKACSGTLSHAVEAFTPEQPLPREDIVVCRQVLGTMTEQEHRLFTQRSDISEHTSYVSQTSVWVFVALSCVFLLLLFSLLLRDALKRRVAALQTLRMNTDLQKSIDDLEQSAFESRLLTASRDEVQLCLTREQVFQSAATTLSSLLPGSNGAFCLTDNSRHSVEVVSSWHTGNSKTGITEIFPPDACCGLRSGRERWRRAGSSEIHCTHFNHHAPATYVCVPMVAHGETLGVLSIDCATDSVSHLIERRMESVHQIVQLAGMAVASLQLRARLEQLSIRDSLTGLFNRHFMQIALDRELSRCRRKGKTLAVLILDIDHFKQFNDRFGHGAGDEVLRSVAQVFSKAVRVEDVACRYGGEEFAIILPESSHADTLAKAETIRHAVSQLNTTSDTSQYGQITISIGIAIFPQDGANADQLLRLADEALYRAKRGGRDRVVLGNAVPLVPLSSASQEAKSTAPLESVRPLEAALAG